MLMILSNATNMFAPSSNMANDHEESHVILQPSRFDSKMKNMRFYLIKPLAKVPKKEKWLKFLWNHSI